MKRTIATVIFVGCCGLALSGCTRHTIDVQPIRIEPIYMTIDVNVRVDRELDEFFDYKQPAPPPSAVNDEPAVEPGAPVQSEGVKP